MDRGKCIIIGAGENTGLDFEKEEGDYIIAVDGGYSYLAEKGIKPDIVVGDFDSLGEIPNNEEVTVLPKEKDDTDTFFALKTGMEKGYTEFDLYCCTGGRVDHTLANIQLLSYLSQRKMKGKLIGKEYFITAVTDGELTIKKTNGYVSIFAQGGIAKGVDLIGMKYPLSKATLTSDVPLGVSNEIIDEEAVVRVYKGTLTVYVEQRKENVI